MNGIDIRRRQGSLRQLLPGSLLIPDHATALVRKDSTRISTSSSITCTIDYVNEDFSVFAFYLDGEYMSLNNQYKAGGIK